MRGHNEQRSPQLSSLYVLPLMTAAQALGGIKLLYEYIFYSFVLNVCYKKQLTFASSHPQHRSHTMWQRAAFFTTITAKIWSENFKTQKL